MSVRSSIVGVATLLMGLVLGSLPWSSPRASSTLGAKLAFQAQPPRTVMAEEAIRKAAEEYAAAFNRGDLETLTGFWAKDAESIDDEGRTVKGREAIVAMIKQSLDDLKGSSLKLTIASVRVVNNVAVEEGESELTNADGSVVLGRHSTLWVQDENGRWLIQNVRDLGTFAEGSGDPVAALDFLLGEWTQAGEGIQIEVAVTSVLGGRFRQLDYRIQADPKSDPTSVRMIVGYDPLSEGLKSWTFDSSGGHSEGFWSYDEESASWVIEVVGVLPGGRIGEGFNLIALQQDDSLVFQARDRTIDGQAIADGEVRLVRKAKEGFQ